MFEQDFIMLIMNCKKYIWKADVQRNTWLKTIPNYLKFYHVIGDEELDSEYKFDNDNNILWVKVPDDYNSLPNKVISSYKAIYETFKFKYLFKTDDDQNLIKPQFFDIITNLIKAKIPSPNYGGFLIDVKQPYLSQYSKIHEELPKEIHILQTKYCSGRFYFLSSKSVSYLLVKRETINSEYLEDYAIGYNLHDYFKTGMLNIDTNKFFIDINNI
jgi:hypothetical protein